MSEKKYIPVLWLKSHYAYAYFPGQTGTVDAEKAPQLMKEGFILPVPGEEKTNPLPADLPGRNKLFEAGYDSLEKIAAAADQLTDVLAKNVATQVRKYLEAAAAAAKEAEEKAAAAAAAAKEAEEKAAAAEADNQGNGQ